MESAFLLGSIDFADTHTLPIAGSAPDNSSSELLYYLIVTNSSAPVGWIATVLSKSAFVAPILIATAKP